MHSLSGTMAISETALRDTFLDKRDPKVTTQASDLPPFYKEWQ